MENKKYYWIKLKTDFFSEDEIDFLLSQKNGCEYVVLYQMLCLKTVNTNGRLQKELGELIVPYDIDKIVRDCKYFDFDTVTVALELYKRLGLIYSDNNGILTITNHAYMIGSESASREAIKKRRYREKKKIETIKDNQGDNMGTNCPTEYRDKSIEYRDKSIEINKEDIPKGISKKESRFAPPTLEEVRDYCYERKNNIDASKFIDFYESKGWMIGKNKMKDWKAAVRTWERRDPTPKDDLETREPELYKRLKNGELPF